VSGMDEVTAPNIVGVRFAKVGKVYHFDASKIEKVQKGDVVIVETSRGWQLGEVVNKVENPTPSTEGTWKAIERLATPRDLLQRQSWQEKEPEVVNSCRIRAHELRLSGVKIIFSEYSYDGSRLTIFFSSDSEDKVELKSLRSDMQRMFAPSQVDIRQIGPRDVAKYLGGMGACGLEKRCCSMFITEFSSISIRMAKEQGISLTPTEITGMCGRLRCCLIYEYDTYVEAKSHLPKKNKRVITPDGEGKVVDLAPLRDGVIVELQELGRREYNKDEIKPAEEYEAFVHKAENPHGGGSSGSGGMCARCKQRCA
jgi:cell fate regulator YaaT (PSP1 superfamily)